MLASACALERARDEEAGRWREGEPVQAAGALGGDDARRAGLTRAYMPDWLYSPPCTEHTRPSKAGRRCASSAGSRTRSTPSGAPSPSPTELAHWYPGDPPAPGGHHRGGPAAAARLAVGRGGRPAAARAGRDRRRLRADADPHARLPGAGRARRRRLARLPRPPRGRAGRRAGAGARRPSRRASGASTSRSTSAVGCRRARRSPRAPRAGPPRAARRAPSPAGRPTRRSRWRPSRR